MVHHELDVCTHHLFILLHSTVHVLVSQSRMPFSPTLTNLDAMCMCAVCKLHWAIWGSQLGLSAYLQGQDSFQLFSGLVSVARKNNLLCFSGLNFLSCAHLYFAPCTFVWKCLYVCLFINTTHLSLALCWRWRRRFVTGCMYLSVCLCVSQYSC